MISNREKKLIQAIEWISWALAVNLPAPELENHLGIGRLRPNAVDEGHAEFRKCVIKAGEVIGAPSGKLELSDANFKKYRTHFSEGVVWRRADREVVLLLVVDDNCVYLDTGLLPLQLPEPSSAT